MHLRLAATCLMLSLAGCQAPAAAPVLGDGAPGAAARDVAGGPVYRFLRGQRSGEDMPTFVAGLATRWLPAMCALRAPDGLVGYLSAVPTATEPGMPDEVALAAYASEQARRRAWSTPAGLAATGLRSGLYAATSREVAVVPFAGALTDQGAYDVLAAPTDWATGFTTFFIGRRQESVAPGDFPVRLHAQVRRERAAFAPMGLRGYVFMATTDTKLSFMHWTDMAAFGRAMASAEGQAVAAESRALMRTVQFAGATPFKGAIAPGQVVTLGQDP